MALMLSEPREILSELMIISCGSFLLPDLLKKLVIVLDTLWLFVTFLVIFLSPITEIRSNSPTPTLTRVCHGD